MLCRDEAGLPNDKQTGPWADHEGRCEIGGILQSFLTSTPPPPQVEASGQLHAAVTLLPREEPLCEVGCASQPFLKKRKISFPYRESKRHSLVLPFRKVVALPTVLPRLRSQAGIMCFYTPGPRSSLLLQASLRPGTHYSHVMCGGTHAYRHVTLSHVSFWRQAVEEDNIPFVSVSV